MKYNKMSRRMFLQGSGSLLAIPFLESLLPRTAWAQTSQPILRYISVLGNFDYGHHRNWLPTLNKPSQIFTPTGEHQMHYQTMKSFMSDGRSSFSRIIVPELTPFLDQMSMYRSLDHANWYGHGSGQLLGNLSAVSNNDRLASLPDIMTIDQVLAKNPAFNPGKAAPLILNDGGWSYGEDATGAIVAKSPISRTVLGAYNILFNNGTYPEAGGTTVVTKHPRSDALSRVFDDYKRVSGGTQISSVDKVVLDNALDLLSDLHKGISADQKEIAATCQHKWVGTTMDGTTYKSTLSMKNYANLIVAAMMCDMSRVVVFGAGIDGGSYDTTPDPNIDFHQGISHQPFAVNAGKVNWEYMGDINADYMRNFMAPLLKGLSSAIDPANGKSMLYNSLVHFGLEHSLVHEWCSAPTLIAGNAGGAFAQGNYVDCTNWGLGGYEPGEGGWDGKLDTDPNFSHTRRGISYNRMLVTIMQSMGLSPADYENPALNRNWLNRTDGLYGAQNNGITSVGGYGYISTPTPETYQYASGLYYSPWSAINYHQWKNPVPKVP